MISRAGDQDALLVHAYKLYAWPTRTFLEFGEEEADGTENIQWWTFFFFFLQCKLAHIVVVLPLVGPAD